MFLVTLVSFVFSVPCFFMNPETSEWNYFDSCAPINQPDESFNCFNHYQQCQIAALNEPCFVIDSLCQASFSVSFGDTQNVFVGNLTIINGTLGVLNCITYLDCPSVPEEDVPTPTAQPIFPELPTDSETYDNQTEIETLPTYDETYDNQTEIQLETTNLVVDMTSSSEADQITTNPIISPSANLEPDFPTTPDHVDNVQSAFESPSAAGGINGAESPSAAGGINGAESPSAAGGINDAESPSAAGGINDAETPKESAAINDAVSASEAGVITDAG